MIKSLTTGRHRLDPGPSRDSSRSRGLAALEEQALAALIARGDQSARNCLVEANLGLVGKIAQEFRRRGLPMEDLIGEGNLGLIRAAEGFDPRFGTRFSTYAAYWIKESIRRALMNTAATIRVPAHVYRLLARWRRSERLLCRKLGRTPTIDEVASLLCLGRNHKWILAQGFEAGRIQLEGGYGCESANRLAREARDRHAPIEEMLDAEEDLRVVLRRMEGLETRERSVLRCHFGLDGEGLTFAEIGRRLGVTRECVRRIHVRALRKLGAGSRHRAPQSPFDSRRRAHQWRASAIPR